VTRQPAHDCLPGASVYYCPASDETESTRHGGFSTCCDRPDLHQLACAHCHGTGQTDSRPCPECALKGLPPRLPIPPHPHPEDRP
jgi:hypothetical protein